MYKFIFNFSGTMTGGGKTFLGRENINVALYVCLNKTCDLCTSQLMLYHFAFLTLLSSLKSNFCCVCCCCFACNGYLIQCNVRIKRIAPSMEQAFAQTRLILLLLTRIAPNTAIYVPALVVEHLVSFFKLLLFVTAGFKIYFF